MERRRVALEGNRRFLSIAGSDRFPWEHRAPVLGAAGYHSRCVGNRGYRLLMLLPQPARISFRKSSNAVLS